MVIYSTLYEENIAHFVGQWHLATEGARLRDELAAFRRAREEAEDGDGLPGLAFNARQYFRIPDYLPGVEHNPEQWGPTGSAPFKVPALDPWIQDLGGARAALGIMPNLQWPIDLDWPQAERVQVGAAPGQVIYIGKQAIYLQDNDILNLTGGPEPEFDPAVVHRLYALTERAETVDVLDALEMPRSPSEIGTVVVASYEILSALEEDAPHVVAHGPGLSGSYVNGEAVDAPLILDDLLPEPFLPPESEEPGEVNLVTKTIDEGVEGALVLQAGANLAMNTAVISSVGLLGGVIAVAGDVYQIDAIIQINAYSDNDLIGDQFISTAENGTVAYNYASFSNVPMSYEAPAAAVEAGIFPSNWIVSVVEGDLIFAQWIVQTIFMLDNDIHVLAETGAYSNFVTGANMAHNINSFSQLGMAYDLILIGGNLYDANIIKQMNVLLDDDGIYTGVANRDNTDISTSDNLLYNGASISNMGAQNWLAGLPEHYLQALEQLAAGNLVMPEGFGEDQAFAGFDMLSVLVVTGNVYDLHYISQTTVVGDADLVAAAETVAVENAVSSGAKWDISTGENALINTAAILDADSLGDVAYVGGDVYSDAILIQAELLGDPSDDDPDALVYEAIAFITSDNGTALVVTGEDITSTPADSNSADVMGSVLT